ncbi:hypothetical protein GDO81_013574 [Engystomops pustulosus]|uniref:Nucleolar protein 4 helical domain-containing protein n=1 Tax=Engystomops pustulosus TaxID=76066 RepID=A0AAV7B0L2_ENGPU|nr:hypothetical protein GDO81_013574 [Engystomops pustulosus]
MNDTTWAEKAGSPSEEEKMRSPRNVPGPEDDDSSSESCNGNVFPALNPSTTPASTALSRSLPDMNGNSTGSAVELSASSDEQPINLSDKIRPTLGVPQYPTEACTTEALRNHGKYNLKATSEMFVRLFVDENLDRMVPISKQPKEKIQAIIESCSRQFPEFQERARKRIRTYLKSCRRMKKSGMEMARPTPPHLTSAMAENILAAACESESRQAAKRMRLEIYQTAQVTFVLL